MHIREFAFATSQAVTEFASRATRVQRVGNGAGEAHAYLIRIDAGGAIGAHPAGFGQLFVPLEGSGWVSGSDGVRQSVRPGQVACIEVGETHSKGSEEGLTALIVQVRAFAFAGARPAR
jgi:quercetin dioxygenase-like cupin family protein